MQKQRTAPAATSGTTSVAVRPRQAPKPAVPAPTQFRYASRKPAVAFSELLGQTELKRRLMECGQAWRTGKNGILLFGPPGTGKTVFAEALAAELGIGFLPVTFGDVASKWINQTTQQVKRVFADAYAQQPVLLFLDEVDSLLGDRNDIGSYKEHADTTNAILTELTNAHGSGVLVVAATNYPDKLDIAAKREGRFDFKIEMPLPDAEARRGLIESRLRAAGCTMDPATLARMVRRWAGFNVPRILQAMGGACRLAKAEEQEHVPGKSIGVTQTHCYRSLRALQGRRGGAPEGAKPLSGLFLDAPQAEALASLATRLRERDRIEAMGGNLPSGILFYGPPGTGKTAAAMALAHECGWPLLTYTGRQLLQTGVVNDLRKQASDLRPALVFIDEADDILGNRAMSPYKPATNELLTLIDGAGGMLPDTVWIAATNNPDAIDPAALRGGRFGEQVAFAAPSPATARRLIEDWAQRKADDGALEVGNGAQDWIDHACRQLAGKVPADIYQALDTAHNAAVVQAVRRRDGATTVTLEQVLVG